MDSIKIKVNKELDGYNFTISPPIRDLIRRLFPNAKPANNIFVGYDIKSDFESGYSKIEAFIYPALLGIDNKADLKKNFKEITFVDTQTGDIIHNLKLSE